MGSDRARLSPATLLLLGLCLALFVLLRARFIGHLLTWDEAMTLCTVKAFSVGGHDEFSPWFWRHPPVFSVLMLFLKPLEAGFAERVEWMAVTLGGINLILLFCLNRRLWGLPVALASAFFLAVMPGCAFFDVWVKTDHPAVTFGLLALLLFTHRQCLYAGLCAGLALLSKETGLFYLLALLLLWALGAAGKRKWSDLAALTVVPLLACGWWYLGVKPISDPMRMDGVYPGNTPPWLYILLSGILEHINIATGAVQFWARPWHFYLTRIPVHLGVLGLLLSLLGALFLLFRLRRSSPSVPLLALRSPARDEAGSLCLPCVVPPGTKQGPSVPLLFWPLLLLVPSYLFLSLLRGKVPWVIMVLSPAWATLQAVALVGLCDGIRNFLAAATPVSPWRVKAPNLARAGLLSLVLTFAVLAAVTRDYEEDLRKIEEGQWRGAAYSRNLALKMNGIVQDEDRLLLTSFHYWKGILPGQACPVFACYFERKPQILLRSHDRPFADLLDDVRTHRIDWALLSPEPGPAEKDVFGGFINTCGLTPIRFEKAYLFRTASLRHP